MDLIRIDGLELRCIVGLRSYERHREQPLKVDIALGLDLATAGRSGRISDSADYARVADGATLLLRFREYRLLEVAAEELAAFLFASSPFTQQVRLRLDKPEALAGRARSAAIEIARTRGAFGSAAVATPYGTRTELLVTDEATVELLTVPPGQELHLEGKGPRLEWLTTGRASGPSAETRSPVIRRAGEPTILRAEGEDPVQIVRCAARTGTS